MKQDYDILIIGAGVVGASLVLALSHLPLRVALIEQSPFLHADSISASESKPIALNYVSVRILKTLIPWANLSAYATPIQTVHISEQGCFAAARITAKEMAVSALGHVIPAAQLGKVLTNALFQLEKMSKQISLDIFNPAQCCALIKKEHIWEAQIMLKEGELKTICARLVIAADGINSIVRKLLAIPTQEQNKGQMALVTTLKLMRHHGYSAYQRFIKQGVVAALPLFGNEVGLVWTASKPLIEELQSLPKSDFLTRVQSLFSYRLGRFIERGSLGVYPIKSFIAEAQVQPGLILLGNAAHSLSPIAAQGLNLALQDMAELADILTKAFYAKKDLMSPSIGISYLAVRLPLQKQFLNFSENLGRLFEQKFGPLTFMRNGGLLAFDCIYPVKKNASRRLMGIHGRLSPLARGLSYQQKEEYVEI